MPSVCAGSAGAVMNVVLTLEPMISSADDWMSGSVRRLMWPLRTVGVGVVGGVVDGGARRRGNGRMEGGEWEGTEGAARRKRQAHTAWAAAASKSEAKRTLLVPYLEGLAADRVQDAQEPALVRVLEHGCCCCCCCCDGCCRPRHTRLPAPSAPLLLSRAAPALDRRRTHAPRWPRVARLEPPAAFSRVSYSSTLA